MSLPDLYDEEITKAGQALLKINQEFMHMLATPKAYEELQKRVHDEFFKIGLVARVDIPTYIVEGSDNEPVVKAPTIEIVGRVPGSSLSVTEEGLQLFDHERKRHEVIKSRERGEKILGEKEPINTLKPKKDKPKK
ncbi:MAG: hypothetical protein KGL39_24505 [Patescibacteria group bacterium]|nr:hypothetical protein [Patescibacteria group bacterium]